MPYVVSLMEETGAREDWQPVISIVLDPPTPLDTPDKVQAFEDSTMTQLRALGVIHEYGEYFLHITDLSATVTHAAGAAIAIYNALEAADLLPEELPEPYDMSGDPWDRNPCKGPGVGAENYQQWLKDIGVKK